MHEERQVSNAEKQWQIRFNKMMAEWTNTQFRDLGISMFDQITMIHAISVAQLLRASDSIEEFKEMINEIVTFVLSENASGRISDTYED